MGAGKIRPATVAGVVGWALLLVAALALAAWRSESPGAVWARLDIASLNLVQAGIQRHVAPWLWDDALLPLLVAPAWLVLGLAGAVLVALALLGRRRR